MLKYRKLQFNIKTFESEIRAAKLQMTLDNTRLRGVNVFLHNRPLKLTLGETKLLIPC